MFQACRAGLLLKRLQIWIKRADLNRPRASPASFKHVGQALYSRLIKFEEKGPIKILVHFCLQVHDG